jgi:phage/plasmid-associated DNA primase
MSTTSINYKDELLSFFSSIFQDETIRESFLTTYANIFLKNDTYNTLYIWVGTGNNGKSMTIKLFETLLPNSIEYLPFNCIFNDEEDDNEENNSEDEENDSEDEENDNEDEENSEENNSELIQIINNPLCKLIVINENDNSTKVNNSRINRLTSGDRFFAKMPFEETKSYDPLNKSLLVITNNLDAFSNSDLALINRTKIFTFNTIFTTKPKNCNELLIDISIQSKFENNKEEYRIALLEILNNKL